MFLLGVKNENGELGSTLTPHETRREARGLEQLLRRAIPLTRPQANRGSARALRRRRAHYARRSETVGLRIERYCTFQAINSSPGVRPLRRLEANERGRWAEPRRRFEQQELAGAGQVDCWSLCSPCA